MNNNTKLNNEVQNLEKELAQLTDELNYYQQIIDKTPAILYTDSIEPLYLKWSNIQFNNITGWDRNHFLGDPKALEEFNNNIDLPKLKENMNKYMQGVEADIGGLYRFRHENGNWIWLYGMAAEFKTDRNGNMTEDVCMSIDISTYAMRNTELEDEIVKLITEAESYKLESLSAKEKEVFDLIIKKKTIKEIAVILNKSYHTVENQKRSIKKKLGVKKISDLANYS